jgi:hypothetical protein
MARRRRRKRLSAFGAPPSAEASCNIGASNKRFMKWLAKARNGHLDREFLRVARQSSRNHGPDESLKIVTRAIKVKLGKAKLVCKVPFVRKSDRACRELSLFKPDVQRVAGCYLGRVGWGFKK